MSYGEEDFAAEGVLNVSRSIFWYFHPLDVLWLTWIQVDQKIISLLSPVEYQGRI